VNSTTDANSACRMVTLPIVCQVADQLNPVNAHVTKNKPTNDTALVAIPDLRERIQSDNPMLTNSAKTPKPKPNELTTRAVSTDDPWMTFSGASGCSTIVNITEAMTPTIKLQAAAAAEPTTQSAIRFEEPINNKVARKVAVKPPRNALRNANCRAISIR